MCNVYESILGKVQANVFLADDLAFLSNAFFTVGNETVGVKLENISEKIKQNSEDILSIYSKEIGDKFDDMNKQCGEMLSNLVK